MHRFEHKKILILGLGVSGYETAKVLKKYNNDVVLNEQQDLTNHPYKKELINLGVQVIDQHHPLELLDGIDYLVKNPGIPYSHEMIVEANKRQIPVITEVEIAYEIAPCKIIGITGTNGKTTITQWITNMINHDGTYKAIACGNIGHVATKAAYEASENSILVMELSSFQLQGTIHFKPDIAIISNLYEAHIDYHGSIKDYHLAKLNLIRRMDGQGVMICSDQVANTMDKLKDELQINKNLNINVIPNESILKDDSSIKIDGHEIAKIEQMVIKGSHNYENALCVCAVSEQLKLNRQSLSQSIVKFSGVEHRLEVVNTKSIKALVINDSKATNPTATMFALKAFEESTITLIAGGLERSQQFDEVNDYFETVKYALVYGENKNRLADFIKHNHPHVMVYKAETLIEVIDFLYTDKLYNLTDVILFSPMSASWDQYKTYEQRGEEYKKIVQHIDHSISNYGVE